MMHLAGAAHTAEKRCGQRINQPRVVVIIAQDSPDLVRVNGNEALCVIGQDRDVSRLVRVGEGGH